MKKLFEEPKLMILLFTVNEKVMNALTISGDVDEGVGGDNELPIL